MLGLNGGNSSGSDPNHESTEPALGSTSNPWRTPETRFSISQATVAKIAESFLTSAFELAKAMIALAGLRSGQNSPIDVGSTMGFKLTTPVYHTTTGFTQEPT
jgi:hypothetical protein